MCDEQRAYQQTTDRIGRRPVCRVVLREPTLPDRQEFRQQLTSVTRQRLDAEGFHLKKSIGHEGTREREAVLRTPAVTMLANNLAGHPADRLSTDIEEPQMIGSAKIAAGV